MLVQKNYRHPLHYINSVRAALKSEIEREFPKELSRYPTPALFRELDYFFCFEIKQDVVLSEIRWGLCVFDSNGVRCFSEKGVMPVSLWRWQRQGLARTAKMVEGVIKHAFNKRWWPIDVAEPFYRAGDGLYQVNINWPKYRDYKPLI